MKTDIVTVLVVDDHADIRQLMKIILEGDGYQVNVAADGVEAFEQLRAGVCPDLIFLDLLMPGMDGEEFMEKMHSSRFAKIPVIIMSGDNSGQRKADELGAAGCLKKPVEFDDLLPIIKRFAPVHSR